jgi:hypothetical protein
MSRFALSFVFLLCFWLSACDASPSGRRITPELTSAIQQQSSILIEALNRLEDANRRQNDTRTELMEAITAINEGMRQKNEEIGAALSTITAWMEEQKRTNNQLSDALRQNTAAVTQNQNYITTINDGMRQKDARIEEIGAALSTITAWMEEQKRANNQVSDALRQNTAAVTQNQNYITTINDGMRQKDARIEEIGAAVDGTNNAVTSLTTRIDRLEAALSCSGGNCIGIAQFRIVGSSNRGRLEVYHNGQWGTVCDDDFSDRDARVFCRSMGLPYASASAIESFGGGSGPIFLDNVNCDGQLYAHACTHNGWGSNNCGHSEDVGICCR